MQQLQPTFSGIPENHAWIRKVERVNNSRTRFQYFIFSYVQFFFLYIYMYTYIYILIQNLQIYILGKSEKTDSKIGTDHCANYVYRVQFVRNTRVVSCSARYYTLSLFCISFFFIIFPLSMLPEFVVIFTCFSSLFRSFPFYRSFRFLSSEWWYI